MKLSDATPAQREAITTDAESVLAVAGPGSGKTATLVARIEHLVALGTRPDEIVVLTFTNAAANELARRMPSLTRARGLEEGSAKDADPIKLGFCGTLHSFALRGLKEHGTAFGYGDRVSLISPEAAEDLLLSKARTLGCKATTFVLRDIKARGRPARSPRMNLPELVVSSYLDDMKASGIVDYDVLLDEFRSMLRSESPGGLSAQAEIHGRFSHLFVDEVQDSAPIDWDIYRALPIRSKFFVGDPDQAIYSFRGGRVAEMIDFGRSSSVLVVALEENFRSCSEVCDAANRLIERNTLRLDKRTRSVRGEGGNVVAMLPSATEGEEVARVAFRIKEILRGDSPTIAVLARTNAIADGFRKTLPALGVEVVEQKRAEIPLDWRLTRSFVDLLVDPDNDALAFFYLIATLELEGKTPAAARTIAHNWRRKAATLGLPINSVVPEFGFGKLERADSAVEALATQPLTREARAIVAERFRELPRDASTLDLAVALAEVREHVQEGEGTGVRVLTIHSAKGREFDVVFIVGFEDEVCPGRMVKNDENGLEEERRLAYVALTRARRDVYFSSSATRSSQWGGVQNRTPSRFIAEACHVAK